MNILDENSLFRQLNLAMFRMRAYADREFFDPHGLTSSCAILLHVIYVSGRASPGELLKKVGGTKSNISQRLNTLRRLGLVKELTSTSDRRSVIFETTEKGKRLYEEFVGMVKERTEKLERLFTEEEKEACLSIVNKINKILDKEDISICCPKPNVNE